MRDVAEHEGFDQQIGRLAALSEPIRRALYRYVASQSEPVGREQAAAALAVPSHVAKFHLDKLEADGLLDSEYSRPPGRSGPGAGRPAKRYRRSHRELSVSLPERRYELAGRIMAQGIAAAAASDGPVRHALRDAAVAEGRRLGDLVNARLGRRHGSRAIGRAVHGVLTDYGYEPRAEDDVLTLANCPFHALAREHTELVCGMNLDLLGGLVETCARGDLSARLDPAPGRCCVTLSSGQKAGTSSRRATA